MGSHVDAPLPGTEDATPNVQVDHLGKHLSRRDAPAAQIQQVPVAPLDLGRLASVLDSDRAAEFGAAAARARTALGGRVVWNISSTAHGGGVAEMLHSLIAYSRGGDVDARWIVIGGEPDFFRITKRIHNRLHGVAGDGGPLGELERQIYESAARDAAAQIAPLIRPGDIALLHDPQTAGLVEPLRAAGAHTVWRSHVGVDQPNEQVRSAAAFLEPYVQPAAAYVFSRQAYVWPDLDKARVQIIAPSIDPMSVKNQALDPAAVRAILASAGILPGDCAGAPEFRRSDGALGRVDRHADLMGTGPPPDDAPLVAQISRWDRLKDPLGVIEGFVEGAAGRSDAHLLLAGPDPGGVADDPEAADVARACAARWTSLAPEVRKRIHLALLPMEDPDENAAIVNALQRWSTIVVQKSLAEGFGLTVSEAMWKRRPVVAGRVGGIQDQIVDGESGVLVDPADLRAFGDALAGLLADPARASAIGARAEARVRDRFLGARHLEQYADLFESLVADAESHQGQPAGP